MVNVGTVKKGIEIGKKDLHKYIWHLCEDCRVGRWAKIYKGKPERVKCYKCAIKARYPANEEWETRSARELGYKSRQRLILYPCEICGKERWIRFVKGKPRTKYCKQCEHIPRRGAKPIITKGKYKGYVLIRIYPEDFFFPMAMQKGYVFEHRLIMAKSLGRCLQHWECVHHKNGVKDDNRLENLELTINGSHSLRHSRGYKDGYVKGLSDGRNKQIKELKQQVELLRRT